MKKVLLKIFVLMVICVVFNGCASSAINKMYTINAVGYAEVEGNNEKAAEKEALENAKYNIANSVRRFLEYKLPLDNEIEQKIIYSSMVTREGKNRNVYYVNLSYNLDLYNFVAKNCDFKNIYSWELLGLQQYYSDYMNSRKPIGIWAKDQIGGGNKVDPVMLSALSVLPVFSGNFLLDKHMMGWFFTVSKTMTLLTAALSPAHEHEIKTYSWIGWGVMTILDIVSVFYETAVINESLKLLQNAVLSEGFDFGINIISGKF